MTRQDHMISFLLGLLVANQCSDLLLPMDGANVFGYVLAVVNALAIVYAAVHLIAAIRISRSAKKTMDDLFGGKPR